MYCTLLHFQSIQMAFQCLEWFFYYIRCLADLGVGLDGHKLEGPYGYIHILIQGKAGGILPKLVVSTQARRPGSFLQSSLSA